MVKTELSQGFLVSFWIMLIGNSTIMWAISSRVTLCVLRCTHRYLRFHMVKTELSPGFLVSFWIMLIGNSTIMRAISSRITLLVLRCILLLEVSHGEDRIIAMFSVSFFLLIGIVDRKFLPSGHQKVPLSLYMFWDVNLYLRIWWRRNHSFFFQLASVICFEVLTVTWG